MLYKNDWKKVKERFEALWENEIIDRCCVSIKAPKDAKKTVKQTSPVSCEDIVKYYTDPEWVMKRNIDIFENTYFGGEALPCIFPALGDAGHAAYFKSKYKFTPQSVWFFPVINDWDSYKLEFDPESYMLKAGKKLLSYLTEQGMDKFFVSMPDNCGSIDALAQLRGSTNLLIDMIEEPVRLKCAIKTVVNVLKKTGNEMFEIIKANNYNGSTSGWALADTWSKGRHMMLQCDLSVMISPQMFEEFVLPELEETAAWLDYSAYHLDGQEQIRHLDMILSVKKINMIQWTPVVGQPCTSEFIPVLKKIQKAGKGLILMPHIWEVEKLLSELSPKGLYLIIRDVESETEAEELIKKVGKMTK